MREWIVVCRVNEHIEACSPPLRSAEDALAKARALLDQGCELLRIEGPEGETITRREIHRRLDARNGPPASAA